MARVVDWLRNRKEARPGGERDEDSAFRALLAHTVDPIITADENGRIQSASPSVTSVMGWSPEELVGQEFGRLMCPAHRREYERYLADFQRTHVSRLNGIRREVTGCRRDGSEFPAELTVSVVQWKGRPLFIGVVRDLSERRRQEAALAARERELSEFLDSALIAMHWATPDGQIVWANQAEFELLGYSAHEYLGRQFVDFHMDRQVGEEIGRRLANHEMIRNVDARLRRKDGSARYVLISANGLWRDGRLVHTRCYTRDITERQRAEEALREAEERFRLLVEGVHDYAIVMLDPRGAVVSWNEGAQRITGYGADEIVGRDDACLFLPDDVQAGRPARELRAAAAEGRFQDEGWRVCKDGARIWVNTLTTALRDEEGRLRGYSRIIRDITERRRAEQAAEERAQEMEAFLSIAAHDLKRPLVSVQGLLAILSEESTETLNDENRQLLSMALDECGRMRQLLKELDKLVQLERVGATRDVESLRGLVERCVERFRERIGARGIKVGIDCTPREVVFARTQVEEALTNLIENAILYGCPEDGARIDIRGRLEGAFGSLSVTDYGPGIAPHQHQRVFQLFRRLDPSGPIPGSGVGLAAVSRLIRRMGGTVALQSDVGQGATFTISFPAELAAAGVPTPAPREASPTPAVAEGSATPIDILVVEDDPVHAEIIRRAVKATPLSRSVHHVTDGDLAIDFVHNRGAYTDRSRFPRPELILLDIRMPRMDGFEVLHQLKADDSTRNIPVIMVSTSDRREDIDRSLACGAADYVTKPVDPAEIGQKIALSRGR